MTLQRPLNRQIAVVRRESDRELARRGFVPLLSIRDEREPEDLILDWDAFDLERNVALFDQPASRLKEGGIPACC